MTSLNQTEVTENTMLSTTCPPRFRSTVLGVAMSHDTRPTQVHPPLHGRSLEFATECGGPAGTCTCPWWSRWTRATECGGPAGTCTCLWWSRWTRATRRSPPPSPTGNLEMLLSDWTWTLNFEHIKDSFKYDVNLRLVQPVGGEAELTGKHGSVSRMFLWMIFCQNKMATACQEQVRGWWSTPPWDSSKDPGRFLMMGSSQIPQVK